MPAIDSNPDAAAATIKVSVFDQEKLLAKFSEHGINPKHARTLVRFVIQRNAIDFAQIPGLPIKAVELLKREFCLTTTRVVKREECADGSTTKLLVELANGQRYPL